jgi:uncharacterized protein DUF3147
MRVRIDLSSLKQTKWNQMLVRFVCGGLATVVAGLVAKKYGPILGGLFLAFPAILPASTTLIEKHEIERKKRAGLHGEIRARKAAGVDAAGAVIGSIGLLVFAALIAGLVAVHSPILIIAFATLSWLLVSLGLWQLRKRT